MTSNTLNVFAVSVGVQTFAHKYCCGWKTSMDENITVSVKPFVLSKGNRGNAHPVRILPASVVLAPDSWKNIKFLLLVVLINV